jgi:penicillin amidase
MRFIKFLISLIITAGLTYLISVPDPMGTGIPAMGELLNPVSGIWQNAEPVNADKKQNFDLDGLTSTVKVVYDERLVPHIFAEDENDAYFVQGFISAQHRLWQMDITARSTAGRVSEVLGERMVDYDKLQRKKGFMLAAKNAVAAWEKSPCVGWIDAYIAGVNAYINQLEPSDYPLEFKLLNYAPEEWSALKIALISKAMSKTLNMREYDLESTNTLQMLGQQTFDELFPEYNPQQTPIIPSGTEWALQMQTDSLEGSPATEIGMIRHQPYPKSDPNIGSNNWVVAGSRTASGSPILCSDPHLNLTLPSIWYEIQIHTPEYNVYGVSLPGIPGVIIGFNEDVAWGFTNSSHDVADWYRMDWANEEKTKYRFDDEIFDVRVENEIIQVKGQESVIVPVKYTHIGPIVYENENPRQDLALRWIDHQEPGHCDFSAVSRLNRAQNHADYIDALTYYTAPSQNAVFASKEGDIALKIIGRMPVKRDQQGRFVQEGNTSANLWQGYVPHEAIPHAKNPERGYLFSANQHTTDPSYPVYYNGKFDDYRARMADRMLSQLDSVTIEEMMAMQNTRHSIFPEEALPKMLAMLDSTQMNTIQLGLVKLLHDWDYRFGAEERAPVLFQEWWTRFHKKAWDEFFNTRDTFPVLIPEKWRTIALLTEQPDHLFWDNKETPETENAADILNQSFKEMVDGLKPKLSEIDYNWGKHWGFQIGHLGRIPAFASHRIEPGGHPEALNAIRSNSTGPSWRMIVELGEEVRAFGVYPGGQSGNPGSPYYDTMVDQWAKGEYYELQFMKDPKDTDQPIVKTQTFK